MSSKPKVLLQTRANLLTKKGGDTQQILTLQHSLLDNGCEVGLCLELTPDLANWDIVHCFNINRLQETAIQVANAKKQGKPVILTTIFHNLEIYHQFGRFGLCGRLLKLFSWAQVEQLRNLYLWLKGEVHWSAFYHFLSHTYQGLGKELLDKVDCVQTNSALETTELEQYFNLPLGGKVFELPVGLDFDQLDQIDDCFSKKYGLTNYILQVARIEDLKNQLGLLEALQDYHGDLVFIGPPNPNHRNYVNQFCRRIKNNNRIKWFDNLTRHQVLSAMKTAQVHVQPSFVETAGLASVEALYLGTSVVITEVGYAQALFGTQAEYCTPADSFSIREAIERASKCKIDSKRLLKLRQNLSVKLVAQKMLDQYRIIV